MRSSRQNDTFTHRCTFFMLEFISPELGKNFSARKRHGSFLFSLQIQGMATGASCWPKLRHNQ
jgi:hypothetical protein